MDMEASAFLQLCEHFGSDMATCLGVVKGVSDFGNAEKGKDESAYTNALVNTAEAIREWVIHRIPKIAWEMDESWLPSNRIIISADSH